MERKVRKLKKCTAPVPLSVPLTAPFPLEPTMAMPNMDESLIYDQDYEYELSVIADMEKREKEQQKMREIEEQNKQMALLNSLETRNFHIKQVLRKLKLGSSTNPLDILYIQLLESWMESSDLELKTEHSYAFHTFLEKGMRLNAETKEYMRFHVLHNSITS